MTRAIGTLLCSVVAIACALAEKEDPNDIVESSDHITHYSRSAYHAGRRDAERDLREGKLIFEFYGGPPPPYLADFEKLLWERYQIQLKQVADCVVDHRIVGHARGYNEVSGAEIDRRFGPDFIMKTREEFRDQWEKNHK